MPTVVDPRSALHELAHRDARQPARNVALPTLARDLGASASAQQWLVDSYSLVFAGLLFTMSSLGERFGRKGIMQLGLA